MKWSYKGRNIRPYRFMVQMLGLAFIFGQMMGLPPFGTHPLLRRIFLPNASCRYINEAPTSCYYYQLQDGFTQGYSNAYIDVILMVLIVLLLIILLGRIWCSWLCPFGLVQEGLIKLRELTGLPPLRMKWRTRVILRRIKYAFLFFTVLLSVPIGISALGLGGCQSTLALPFCQVCPAKGFFTIAQQLIGLEPWSTTLPWLAVVSLVLFLVCSFFIDMAFCRICPMGGVMALMSRLSLPWLRKDPNKCTRCKVCLRVCPLDHDRVYEDMEADDVGSEDCILCGKCVEMCPEEGCLTMMYGPFSVKSSRRPRKIGLSGSQDRKKNRPEAGNGK
ncbi:MAG: 4Fe-4S binding protein [Candidatus Thermoplasmatota archaeon]|nr:4Fe-4S binding protein [Candidatus Thermoplasmatota archaeon]